ncbi:MAG: 16S rRNA (guanine(966)-N(2))-methyltransferase RsmD [Clostridia bacterium]|nr:16S rRNA (guanine(966)-N(2))-methyltransferase RsmD [Clostridia bacterium]
MLKIITGKAKGKKILTLEGEATRPTSERIKEAVFSSIQFEIENRRVLDLFAGSGQMGLEALSRGAESAMFIDAAKEAMDIVKKNAEATGFFGASRFLVSDYRNYIRKAAGRDVYDLVFVDPPYGMECCRESVERLLKAGMLADGALVVLESGTEFDELPAEDEVFSSFEVLKSTHYGKKTFVNILKYRKGETA